MWNFGVHKNSWLNHSREQTFMDEKDQKIPWVPETGYAFTIFTT